MARRGRTRDVLNDGVITHRFGGAGPRAVDSPCRGEIRRHHGHSGVGKSTLGRILAGHLVPTAGRVEVDGKPPGFRSGEPCPVQYAPQVSELSLDPRWRVGRILRNGGAPDPRALPTLGIRIDWEDRFPAELSGGELARVSLARLVLPSTRYLICDEITAPLDALAAQDMISALKRLAGLGFGILLISHNQSLLKTHVDRHFQLQSRAARMRGCSGKTE